MSKPRVQPAFDPAKLAPPTQENFYNAEDLACAAKDWPRAEVEDAFTKYREAVDNSDHQTMADMFAEGGRGGNTSYGFFFDAESYLQFLQECWLEVVPNYSMWQAIDGGRVVNKWCEVLPGTSPAGGRYDYFGINEVIYSGEGCFRLMFSLPDLSGLSSIYARWKADGQHEVYGDIYPSLGG